MATRTFLLAVFLTFVCETGRVISAQLHENGKFRFSIFEKIADGQLFVKNGTLLKNSTKQSKYTCLLECVEEEKCLSINLYFDQPKQFQCELLNWGGTAFDRYLKPRANSHTMQIVAACSPNPCQNGGECNVIAGGHQYFCNCTKHFSGKNCEKAGCVIFDFEDGLTGWTRTGTAFNNQPTYGDNTAVRRPNEPANIKGDWYIGTFENRPSPSHKAGAVQGDGPKGTMTSPQFLIRGTTIKYLIGGGADSNTERVELLIDGTVVAEASSLKYNDTLNQRSFDVTSYRGQLAQLRLVDEGSEEWHHINVDHFEDSICSE